MKNYLIFYQSLIPPYVTLISIKEDFEKLYEVIIFSLALFSNSFFHLL